MKKVIIVWVFTCCFKTGYSGKEDQEIEWNPEAKGGGELLDTLVSKRRKTIYFDGVIPIVERSYCNPFNLVGLKRGGGMKVVKDNDNCGVVVKGYILDVLPQFLGTRGVYARNFPAWWPIAINCRINIK